MTGVTGETGETGLRGTGTDAVGSGRAGTDAVGSGRPARPLTVRTDLALGGRWTSLATPEREWLWRNERIPDTTRAEVKPGDPFVDAGGVEECFPTLNGPSDHGEVWSRPWAADGSGPSGSIARIAAGNLTLRRSLTADDGVVRASYRIEGPPGASVLHAVHMLLDVGPGARLEVSGRPEVLVVEWPERGATRSTTWPDGGGLPLDTLGPDDGTARCAVVASDRVDVVDGADRLSLTWGVESGQAAPVSFVVWRNLVGWPMGAPYRSIGVEPLLGAESNLDRAAPEQLAHLDEAGRLGWWLEIRASR
ncbi:hypothetical protein AB1046_09775 [Promicromonospora sp. Populi]|uniref:hypothetical protein n=1 Tax=Promicromonospora sp. Populi TaxID=3239420 RepID=UPI0034E2C1B6